jgi:Fuc2NAc and GlcNAc transferase
VASVPAASLVVAAGSLGFLIWKWPPAKIFIGDVGSGYLGFVIAVLAIAATRQNPASLWTWLILSGVFIVDATVTALAIAAGSGRSEALAAEGSHGER